jgi:hypothetical protein
LIAKDASSRLRTKQDGLHIGSELAVELSLVDRFKFGGFGDARIVHEHIKSSAGLCKARSLDVSTSL